MINIKKILLSIMNIINIPISLLLITGLIWFILPNIQFTNIGQIILNEISNTTIFYITLGSGILWLTFFILSKVFSSSLSSKFKNFFIHLNTWVIALWAITLCVFTFVSTEIQIKEFELTNTRKIGIGVTFVLLFICFIVASKLGKVVNRRIQSYETAKEMNVIGRGSIIWTNILKLFEILFPQVLVLLLICFCLSWNVATYFIVVLCAMLIPMFGNIESDFNIRAEIKRNNEIEKNDFINNVAQKVKGE